MIRYAINTDIDILLQYDKHISKNELKKSIELNRVIVMFEENKLVGWLRFNMFWDSIPFMNMLYFLENERNKGYGTRLIKFWENKMKFKGYDKVMTSTQENETAKYFYTKKGYKECGSFTLPGDYLELIFYKEI